MDVTGNTRSRTKAKLAGTRVLDRKDHVLLKNSEAVKAIPALKKLLDKFPRITSETLLELPEKERDLFETMKNELITQAAEEWIGEYLPDADLGDDRIKCLLCGTDNKLVFMIENKLNGVRLNVGSTCINEFGIRINERGKTIAEYRRSHERIRRKIMLGRGISEPEVLDKWDTTSRYSIIIPRGIREPFDKLGAEFQEICDKFITKKCGPEVFPKLNQALETRNNYLLQFNDYVTQNENKPFVITREYYDWAKINFPKDAIDAKTWIARMEQSGVIDWGIGAHLAHEKFAASLIRPLNLGLAKIGAQIVRFERNNKLFKVILPQQDNIILDSSFCDIVQNFGGSIFKPGYEQDTSLERLVQTAKVAEHASIDRVILRIGERIKVSGFHFDQKDASLNDLIIYRRDIDKYVKDNPFGFANTFLLVALSDKKSVNVDSILDYIKALPGRQYTFAELKETSSFDQIMRRKEY